VRSDRLRVQPATPRDGLRRRAVVYALWIRPRMLRWGATPDETSRIYPGDELVPDPDGGRRWPRPCQHHRKRSGHGSCRWEASGEGWYSWDRLDNDGRPSTDRIVPEWQNLRGGTASAAAAEGADELVDRSDPGAGPHHGAANELRPDRPIPSGPARCLGHAPRGLGASTFAQLPRTGPAWWSGRGIVAARDCSMDVRGTCGGAGAFHHADPSVPQPAHSGRALTPSFYWTTESEAIAAGLQLTETS